MRFWDSSALVPLLSDERWTDAAYEWYREDPDIVVAFITPLEVTSAIYRQAGVNLDLRKQAERRYAVLEATWEVIDRHVTAVELAKDLVARHRLRAGDAIQLASTLIACAGQSEDLAFVTTDAELATAARAEGFPTLP